MRIERVDEVLKIYDENFPKKYEMNPRLEFILAQALLVVIYSEFEKKFKNMVVERFSLAQDRSPANYISSFRRGSILGLKLGDISGFIGRFGQEHRDTFKGLIKQNGIACDMYNSIVINRHEAAHGSGSSETISGVKKLYDSGHIVLDLFEQALWAE